jgi:hypothetical protein
MTRALQPAAAPMLVHRMEAAVGLLAGTHHGALRPGNTRARSQELR